MLTPEMSSLDGAPSTCVCSVGPMKEDVIVEERDQRHTKDSAQCRVEVPVNHWAVAARNEYSRVLAQIFDIIEFLG